MFLSEHMKETIDRVDGYITGTLFVEDGEVGLQTDKEELIVTADHIIEVRNGNEYELVTYEDILTKKTKEDWPLFAGLYARVKLIS